MSKITFRADDDLVRQLEEFDASKSEVMREALRKYLGQHGDSSVNDPETGVNGSLGEEAVKEPLEELIVERVDELVADRLGRTYPLAGPQDVNVNISIDDDSGDASSERTDDRKTLSAGRENASDDGQMCKQCGESLSGSSVYCPNCGEKSSHRVFCECGDELRSDWGFCPGCGRRTPAADVLRDS